MGILVKRLGQIIRGSAGRVTAALFMAGTLYPYPALAKGDGDIWSIDVAFMCWAQDPAYRETSFGKLWAKSAWFPGWDAFDRRFDVQCLRQARWASDALCTDLMQRDEKGLSDLGPLYARYKREIRGMESAFEYMNKQVTNKKERLPCPEKRAEPSPDREALEAGVLLKSFGLAGRWATNCADKAEKGHWIVYSIASSGQVTAGQYFVLRSVPELVREFAVTSARLLQEDQIELRSREEYPDPKFRYLVTYRKTAAGMRVMQSSIEEAGNTTQHVKDGLLLKTGAEMPLLNHCDDK